MALSEAEEKWLEDRDAIQFATGEYLCGLYPEMLVDDFQDAAEFEARVAEKLAIDRATGKHLRPKGCSWYETAKDGQRIRQTACPPHHDIDKCAGFATCSLYHARLAVEAEMDNTAGSK